MQIEMLREFVTLSQTLNFRQTAARHFMNVSSLSRHIRSMESELGVTLLARNSRNVELTEDGLRILDAVRQVVDDYDRLLDLAGENDKELRVATPLKYSLFSDLLAEAIPLAKQLHPRLRCRFIDLGVAAADGEIPTDTDAILLELLPGRPNDKPDHIELFKRRAGVWLSADNPLSGRERVALHDLDGLTYRSTASADNSWTRAVAAQLVDHGFTPTFGETVDDLYQLGPSDYAIVYGGRPSATMGLNVVMLPLVETISFTVAISFDKRRITASLSALLTALKQVGPKFDDVAGVE